MKAKHDTGREMKHSSLFTHNTLKNCHIEFSSDGNFLWVSLNIEPRMIKHLSPNNLYKGDSMNIYALKKKLTTCSITEIEQAHEELLKRAMVNCREAKIKAIQSEIQTINVN